MVLETTRRLRSSLEKLMHNYPEEALHADERIWPRLLSHDWRYLAGDSRVPAHLGYSAAVEWIDAYWTYVDEVRDFCNHVAESPETFRLLPLNGNQRASAQQT